MSTAQKSAKKATKPATGKSRDARGRFTKGNAGGPGNPFAREVAVLRATMIHAFSPKIFMRLVEVLRQKAEGGDMVAMKLILQYVLGKPAETVDPDRIAIDEWQKLRDAAVSLDETSAVLEQVPATMACFLLKKFWPDETVQHVREALQEDAQAKAEAEEDERYMERKEAAEAEALKQKAEVAARRPEQDAPPARDSQQASARREAQPATPKVAARHGKSPSTHGANGTSPREETAPTPSVSSQVDSFMSELVRRLGQRLGCEEAMAGSDSPSTNGARPALHQM
jgi:hypothetical protein